MDEKERRINLNKSKNVMVLLLIGTIIFGMVIWVNELIRIAEINQWLRATACINDDCGSWCALFPIECNLLKMEKKALKSISPFEFLLIIVICIEIVIIYYFSKAEKEVKEKNGKFK